MTQAAAQSETRRTDHPPKSWRICNLQTQFEPLLKRADLKPWRRLFHVMRTGRETDLAQQYPIHVVTAWLDNTPRIAMKHYLQGIVADFEQAFPQRHSTRTPGVAETRQERHKPLT